MEKEIKKQWLAALRSGEYQQCTEVLRESGSSGAKSYCCLGVLAEVQHGKAVWEGAAQLSSDERPTDEGYWERQGGVWAFYCDEEIGVSRDVGSALASMNDGGDSFDEIANYIEENL